MLIEAGQVVTGKVAVNALPEMQPQRSGVRQLLPRDAYFLRTDADDHFQIAATLRPEIKRIQAANMWVCQWCAECLEADQSKTVCGGALHSRSH